MISILGIPYDENSSFLRGAAKGPEVLLEALHSPSSNMATESGLDLGDHSSISYVGNVEPGDEEWLSAITNTIDDQLRQDHRVISLGGDHAVTYPLVRGYAGHYDALSILHIDAHPDLYDEFEGNRYSHACPFARIMENVLCKRLVQVGIRTMTPHQKAQADKFGVEVYGMSQWQDFDASTLEGPVYLSVDLDALDPAFAPGVSHPEPGGLSTRDVVQIIQDIPVALVGADIVELNPDRDVQELTARAGAKILKEILANMLA